MTVTFAREDEESQREQAQVTLVAQLEGDRPSLLLSFGGPQLQPTLTGEGCRGQAAATPRALFWALALLARSGSVRRKEVEQPQ